MGGIIYREVSLKGLLESLERVIYRTAQTMFVIACASVFGWVLTSMQVPQKLVAFMTEITSSPYVILFIINVILLIIGTFMSANAALIIMAPILHPLILSYGIDPIHFGVVMVFNLMLGLLTPPVGTCLYMSAEIAGITVEKTFLALIPFLIVQILVLFVITYFPAVVLFLPTLFAA